LADASVRWRTAREGRDQVYVEQWFEHRRKRRKRVGRSQVAASGAISRGKLVRGACERCGKPSTEAEPSQPHHVDLEYALENRLHVKWLCGRCHQECHREHYEQRRQLGAERGEPWWMRDENDNFIVRPKGSLGELPRRSFRWWDRWQNALSDATPYGERRNVASAPEEPVRKRKGRCEGCSKERRVLRRIESGQWVCRACVREIRDDPFLI